MVGIRAREKHERKRVGQECFLATGVKLGVNFSGFPPVAAMTDLRGFFDVMRVGCSPI
jgi:hypothetical protein